MGFFVSVLTWSGSGTGFAASTEKILVIIMDELFGRDIFRSVVSERPGPPGGGRLCNSSRAVDLVSGARLRGNPRGVSNATGLVTPLDVTPDPAGLMWSFVLETKGNPVEPNIHPKSASVSSRLSLATRL